MPLITDWLMFGITAIYVIATIFICRANIKAANASRDQIKESQKQFETTKRLECMPFLQMEISHDNHRSDFEMELPFCNDDSEYNISKIVKLKNIGNGTATNIIYTWECKATNTTANDYPPINAIMQGDSYYVLVYCDANDSIPLEFSSILTFQYNDLLGNTYEQKVIMHFNADTLLWCENDMPRCLGIVKYSLAKKEK